MQWYDLGALYLEYVYINMGTPLKKMIFCMPFFGFLFSYLFMKKIFFFKNLEFFNVIEDEFFFCSKKKKSNKFSFFFFKIWCSLQSKGLIDHCYNTLIVKPVLNFSYKICYIELDRGWLEFFFVKFITIFCFNISNSLNKSFKTLTLAFLPTMLYVLIIFICFLLIISF
jgi:hypothetical protein